MHVLIIPSWYPTKEKFINGIFFRNQALALKKNNSNIKIGVIVPPATITKIFTRRNVKRFFNFLLTNYKIEKEIDNEIPTYRINNCQNFFLKNYNQTLIDYTEKLFINYVNENGIPDVIHAHSILRGGISAYYFKKKYNIQYVITEHITHYKEGKIVKSFVPLYKKAYRNATKRIVVSPQLGEMVESFIGQDFLPWIYIPNMVDDTFFKKKSITKKNDGFVFINIGMMNLSDKKGHRLLIKSFYEVSIIQTNSILKIIGDGPNKINLIGLINEYELSDKVILLGKLKPEKVRRELENANVLVVSSRSETFGIAVIEAHANGLPVIATECGGPEAIINDRNGVIIPNENSKALSQAMINMQKEFQKYDRMYIVNECMEKYSSATISEKLYRIYNKICIHSRVQKTLSKPPDHEK